METILGDHLRLLHQIYLRRVGGSAKELSTKATGDRRTLTIKGARGFRVETYDRAVGWFRSNWPDDEPFPELRVAAEFEFVALPAERTAA